jgi:hypothetical protein
VRQELSVPRTHPKCSHRIQSFDGLLRLIWVPLMRMILNLPGASNRVVPCAFCFPWHSDPMIVAQSNNCSKSISSFLSWLSGWELDPFERQTLCGSVMNVLETSSCLPTNEFEDLHHALQQIKICVKLVK